MSIPEEYQAELKRELVEEFERQLEEVRACPMTFGSLEPILTRAAQRMARLTQESLARAASEEAAFPPSGVSPMRRGEVSRPEDATAAGGDGLGRDWV